MFRLYGFITQNSLKTLYVLEEVSPDFEFHFVNLGAGEQNSDEFAAKTPVGKVPVLGVPEELPRIYSRVQLVLLFLAPDPEA